MAGLANFKGKKAAPFAKRKGPVKRKKSSTKTAQGAKKK